MTIQKAAKMLMILEPFYGLFLSTLEKREDDNIRTLGVGIENIRMILYYNLSYWNKLSDKEQIAVLKHECSHLCFFHLIMRNSFSNHDIFNIAADVEINCYIDNLPENCYTVQYLKKIGIDVDPSLGTNEYYKILERNKEKLDLKDNIGNHTKWNDTNEMSESEKKLISNQIEYTMKNLAGSLIKNQGTIPTELRESIGKMFVITKPAYDWRKVLKRSFLRSKNTFLSKTMKRPSKRFDDSPGLRTRFYQNILVAIDTSGSVNDKELEEFFNEISYIYKQKASITVIECDSEIGRTYLFRGQPDLNITGGGGTSFIPVIDYYNLHNREFDNLIYFTDGCANIKDLKTKKQMTWVISSNGDQDKEYPGFIIKIPKK